MQALTLDTIMQALALTDTIMQALALMLNTIMQALH